jgi:hypothetical protein
MHWLLLVLWALVLVRFGMPIVFGPVALRARLRLRAMPEQARLEREEVPPPVLARFDECAASLAEEGCVFAGFARGESSRGTRGYQATFVDEQSGARLSATSVVTEAGLATQTDVLFARTPFTDGTSIATTNRAGPSAFVPDPRLTGYLLEGIDSASAVLVAHRLIVEAERGRRVPTVPRLDEVLEEDAAHGRAGLARTLRAGWLEREGKGEFLRPTWLGALALTLRFTSPGKDLVAMRRRREGKQALERARAKSTSAETEHAR